MKISIILASYDSGHYHGGMGQGPDAIVAGGLVDALTLAGHDVAVTDIGRVGDEQSARSRPVLLCATPPLAKSASPSTAAAFPSSWPAIA